MEPRSTEHEWNVVYNQQKARISNRRKSKQLRQSFNPSNRVLVSVIAVFWATIPNPTRPRVADSGTPYRYIG